MIEQIDDAINEIEGQMFNDPTPDSLERLFMPKRVLLRLRRTVAPQREVLDKLARGDYDMIGEKGRWSQRRPSPILTQCTSSHLLLDHHCSGCLSLHPPSATEASLRHLTHLAQTFGISWTVPGTVHLSV